MSSTDTAVEHPPASASADAHWYSLNLHRGDIHMELMAHDAAFVQQQLQRWMGMLDDTPLPVPAPVSPASTNEPVSEANPETEVPATPNEPAPVAEPTATEQQALPITEKAPAEAPQPPLQEATPEPDVAEAATAAPEKPAPSEPEPVAEATPEPMPTVESEPPAVVPEAEATEVLVEPSPEPEQIQLPGEPAENPTEAVADTEPVSIADRPVEEHPIVEPEALLPEPVAEEVGSPETPPEDIEPAPSLTDQNHPPEAGDEDFEKVMSTLMADLQVDDSELALSDHPAAFPTERVGADDNTNQIAELASGLAAELPSEPVLPGQDLPVLPEPMVEADAPSVVDGMQHHEPPIEAPAPAGDVTGSDHFAEICQATGAATPEDHLLISAYTLATRVAHPRFSLAQLNDVITGAGNDPANHSVLEVALSKGLLVMVPDLTGTAEATEYELTDHGRSTVDTFL